jgi:hypothetical protein
VSDEKFPVPIDLSDQHVHQVGQILGGGLYVVNNIKSTFYNF